MKKEPFTYIIECGNFDSFSCVMFAMRDEVKHNAAVLKIYKDKCKIWGERELKEQIDKCRAFFKVYKSVRNHWRETSAITGLKY